MSNLLLYEIVFVLILCGSTEAFLHSYPHVRASRVQRNVDCSTDQYLDGSICCTNCPAGTHVKSRCTTAGQRGTCQECQDGKYTAHANGLRQCLKCTVCRSDQETVTQCTTIQDTLCQCRPGTFCTPDQACELCRTCSTCKRDEEAVRNCTSTSNTQCKKIQANPDSNSANNYGLMVALVLIFTAVVALIIIIIIGVNCYKKRCHQTDARGHLQDEMKAAQNSNEDMRNGETQRSSFPSWVRSRSSTASEDELKMLCESLNSSASNSQHSLVSLPSPAFPALQPPAYLQGPEQLILRVKSLLGSALGILKNWTSTTTRGSSVTLGLKTISSKAKIIFNMKTRSMNF
ncbi:tumor necrosis factor receptor superfamily member 10B-like isoform X3 [Betta splendens]|uniref:Tumor necrosis factor receptor superfamily member 10B-like isoform X3 n=1 Tax=Betta splendens TaxID=158456 RepID=A0A6P7L634_BETSP|nr:tumor necrosis factor receptor superfamily member 10B-like isoform X3 [Betta splendens]